MTKYYYNRHGRLCQRRYLEVIVPGFIVVGGLLYTLLTVISPKLASDRPVFEIKARVDVSDLNHYFKGQHDVTFNNGLSLYEYEM